MRREWHGAVELDVTTSEGTIRALAYPELTGRPEPGDRLLLNTSALTLASGSIMNPSVNCTPISSGPNNFQILA